MTQGEPAIQRVLDLCLSLPETMEVGSWGHPNFRAGERTFLTYDWIQGRPSIAFKLNATDINGLLGRSAFFLPPYGRGRWVSMWADGRLNWRFVDDLLRRSYRLVALKRMISALDGDQGVRRPAGPAGPANKALQPAQSRGA